MRKKVLPIGIGVLIAAVFIVLAGCSSAREVSKDVKELNRERALEHFMNGLMYDLQGQYASAILEYQDALNYYDDAAIYNALAKNYSLLGKHSLAVQMGKEAVKRDPKRSEYHETLADAYLRAFQFEEALKEYDEIIRLSPNDIQAWYNKARLLQFRAPLRAIEAYQTIIDRFGPNWDTYLQLAQLYEEIGNHEKAAEALEGLLNLDPSNNEIRKSLGDLYIRQDSVDTALKLYNEILELNPNDYAVRAAAAYAYLIKKDYKRATEQFEIALLKDTLSVEQQLAFGQVFVSVIEKDSAVAPLAIELFETIQRSHPDDWRPYWFLATISNILHDDSTALKHYLTLTKLAAQRVDGWVGAASVLYDQGKFQEAAELLEEAKQFITNEFRIYFLLGITYQRQKKANEAALALETAIQLNSKSVDAHSALGLVYYELERYQDSDSLYERALRLDPHNHLVLNNYSYSLAVRGIHLERALQMAKEAVDKQPENQAYLDTKGWVYFKLHDYEKAEHYIKKAIDLGSKSAVIHEHLGDVYSKLGKKDKALEYWQKAYELDSSNTALIEKMRRGSL